MTPPTERPTRLRLDFVIAGVQKAGTTALASFLECHPDLCLADEKEVHLFDDPAYACWDAETIERRYAEACSGYRGQRLVGEATPIYLYWPNVVEELHRYNSDMRVIVLLRAPVERAISHHRMEYERGNESLPLLPALLAEGWRLRRDRGNRALESSWRRHSYTDRGFYARQIDHLFRVFPREQVLVLQSERLWSDHAASLQRVYAFLGVDPPNPLPEREFIFSSGPDPRPHRLARWFLRTRLRGERSRLRALLPDLQIAW